MRKIFMAALLLIAALGAQAQNIQVHYDFGKHIYSTDEETRQDATITYETFKADGLGSWFYFIDVDIDKLGVYGAYTELSREFNVGDKGFAAHVELDGGMSKAAGQFQSAVLVGPAWNGHNADFSTTYSLQAMYKHFFGQEDTDNSNYASFQLTGVWSTTFAQGKLTFAGFADLWLGKKASDGKNCLVFITEPQLWYNVCKGFSVGTEIEMSNNFVYRSCAPFTNDKFFVNPTLAVKFNL